MKRLVAISVAAAALVTGMAFAQGGLLDEIKSRGTRACLMFCVCRVVVKGLAPCLTQTLNRSLKRLMISLKNPLSRRFQLRNWQRPELWMACSNRLTGANFN